MPTKSLSSGTVCKIWPCGVDIMDWAREHGYSSVLNDGKEQRGIHIDRFSGSSW